MRNQFPGKGISTSAAGPSGAGDDPATSSHSAPPLAATMAEANRARRGQAMAWLRSPSALPEMVVMAVVLPPIMRYMTAEIAMGSAVAASQKAAACIESLSSCESIRQYFADSQWPALVAAEGTLDKRCLDELSAIEDPSCFTAFLEEWRSVKMRCALFRAMSRQGACVKERLVCKHRRFPFRLFCLLAIPGLEQDILQSCASSRCDYTKSFIDAFGSELCGTPALLELALVVMSSRTSTLPVESSNASLRRRFVATSIQTTKPELHNLSAEFMLSGLRRRRHEAKYPPGHKHHWIISKFSEPTAPVAKKRGGGGAWSLREGPGQKRRSPELGGARCGVPRLAGAREAGVRRARGPRHNRAPSWCGA